MNFKKGQIVEYDFPKIEGNDSVLEGRHKAVVLFSRQTPYRTILIAPITTAESLDVRGEIPNNYVELKVENYIGILEHNSYINLDMIFPVDDTSIDELERYNKKIVKYLVEDDNEKLDYKIALTYELQKYLKKQINHEVQTIAEYIDTNIKEQIKKALEVIDNKEVFATIMYIIDNNLVSQLKEIYN